MSEKADEEGHREPPGDNQPDDNQPDDKNPSAYLANELGALASLLGSGQQQDGVPQEDVPHQRGGTIPATPSEETVTDPSIEKKRGLPDDPTPKPKRGDRPFVRLLNKSLLLRQRLLTPTLLMVLSLALLGYALLAGKNGTPSALAQLQDTAGTLATLQQTLAGAVTSRGSGDASAGLQTLFDEHLPALRSSMEDAAATISILRTEGAPGETDPSLRQTQTHLRQAQSTLRQVEEGRDYLIAGVDEAQGQITDAVARLEKDLNVLREELRGLEQDETKGRLPWEIILAVAGLMLSHIQTIITRKRDLRELNHLKKEKQTALSTAAALEADVGASGETVSGTT